MTNDRSMFKVNKTGKLTANVKNMRLFQCGFGI